ncbi:MAG: FAD-dependent oxidoreductase [Candidatus Latescibacteria bacterium]|jgi:flavin-dependent dehydrogenase|nr:FAD-dependent oxidoreductase [Candidatus Latescibacterota bacterium]MBT4136564.1 FAD-dependent oxidoreductase [Candidatus Latescibacterota bacterium]
MNKKDHYDVIVIGGGPAGSTTAALVAEYGHRVLLLERDKFPRFQIGESLMPGTYWSFERLGLLDKLKKSSFVRKYSVQFFSGSGKGSAPFYFNQHDDHESSVTWQVVRSEFDKMMLDNAEEKGAVVKQGASVHQVLFDGERATGVQVKYRNGRVKDLSASVIVDATGRSALISRKLKTKTVEPTLKKASIFTHFKGAHRDEGIDEGATIILNTKDKDSWFWSIPLPNDVVSVGVVGDLDYLLQSRKKSAQEILEEELDLCLPMKARLEGAEQVFPVKVTQDFSYRSSELSGEGWVLVGDAFGFVDPVYSSGVFLALKSGEMAADAIHEAIEKEDFSAEQLGKWGPEFMPGMEAIRKLVYAFYSKDFSFAKFLKQHPECIDGVVDILSGNVYINDVTPIFEPMGKMCYLPKDVSSYSQKA